MATTRQSLERDDIVELSQAVGKRVENLFSSGRMLCAPAVLTALNTALAGGLTDQQAQALSSALPEGMGGAGCTCGALSGAVLALGLFLGGRGSGRSLKEGRKLHDLFKERQGATCCRVLRQKVKDDDPKAHLAQCAGLSAQAAEMATLLILQRRPELGQTVDWDFLEQRERKLVCKVRKVLTAFKG